MPHLILEYSSNINSSIPMNHLFDKIHHLLAEELPTQLANCKSRCIVHPLFFLGDQDSKNAFVHLTIKIFAGRADAKKKQIGEKIIGLLDAFFRAAPGVLKIDLSLEIMDLDSHYFKS